MVLVSVIGDFYSSILPIFYEFKDKITTHIIVHDDFRSDEIFTQKIVNGTLKFIRENNLNIKSYVIKMDEDSFTAAKTVTQMIDKHLPKKEYEKLYINITDGLANIGVMLSDAFKPKGANILTYDRYDNEYNILKTESMKTYKVQNSLPIRIHLQLKDVEIVETQDISFAKKYEKNLNLFFEKYEADKKLYNSEQMKSRAMDEMPTGFLYEYYIYNLIKDLNYDDILMGVRVKDKLSSDLYTENEYDILVMKENHLHMIECKHRKELDITALLYKLDSIRTTLDEDANIMIVSNFDEYKPSSIDNKNSIPIALKRGLANKIHFRGSPKKNILEFIQDVNEIFGLKSDNLALIAQKNKHYLPLKDQQREEIKQEISDFLKKKLAIDINFFDYKELQRLLQYEQSKTLSSYTKETMRAKKMKNFIKMILTMLNSLKGEVSLFDLHDYYIEHFKS